VVLSSGVQGSITCTLTVDGVKSDTINLEGNKKRRNLLAHPVVIRRGTFVAIRCIHNKQIWSKTPTVSRNVAFREIVKQVRQGISSVWAYRTALICETETADEATNEGANITLQIELDPARGFFDIGSKSIITLYSDAKINHASAGIGFYYLCLLADGSITFERRLRNQYPQEIVVFPVFPLHPQVDLQLCLYRRPFYVWPLRTVVKSSPVSASEIHHLLSKSSGLAETIGECCLRSLSVGGLSAIEHVFPAIPEIIVRLGHDLPCIADEIEILLESTDKLAKRRKLLRRLGRSKDLLENMARILSSACEMNSIAKAVASGLGLIYNVCVLDNWNDQLHDLIEDMTAFLVYIDHINVFTSIPHFQQTLKALVPIIERTGLLISKYQRHGACFSFQTEMNEYNDLKRRFERWTDDFLYGLNAETLKQIGQVREVVEELNARSEFVNKWHNSRRDEIKPPGLHRVHPIPRCLGGTREQALEVIASFAASRDSRNILWITGHPGCGKSCVVCSAVERLKETAASNYGASFFFQRDDGNFTAPSTMLRSICADLCENSDFLMALNDELGSRTPDFATTSIMAQFRRLIYNPLQVFANDGENGRSLVIFIDGIDECGGLTHSHSRDAKKILSMIHDWANLPPSLRLVVTSRDETWISAVLSPISTRLELELDSHEAKRDIDLFFREEFRRIGEEYHLPDWPTQDEMRDLNLKANGLFVWAATVVTFVDRPDPQEALHSILYGDMDIEGDLSRLYTAILRLSFDKSSPKLLSEFKDFVGAIVTAHHPLEKDSPLFTILGIRISTIKFICDKLRPVLRSDKAYLAFRHLSFVDFLRSDGCPRCFRIQRSRQLRSIALALLKVLDSNLHFDVSKFRTSYQPNPKQPAVVSGELSFACKYWADTLSALQPENERDEPRLLAALKKFLETKFLFWLETLSLMKEMPSALSQLMTAKEFTSRLDTPWKKLLNDAMEFVEAFGACVSKCAPHVYLSALNFTPPSSKIYQLYSPWIGLCTSLRLQTPDGLRDGRRDVLNNIVYVAHGDEVAQHVEGHVDDVLAALFIQRGHVASASNDGSLRFWNPDTGKPVRTPLLSDSPITCLAFHSPSKLLVFGSHSGALYVWDQSPDHPSRLPRQSDAPVTSVAVSPGGIIVASGYEDGTVAFWDVRTRRQHGQIFSGHSESVSSVIFLDDETVLSGSFDKSIFIHRVKSGKRDFWTRLLARTSRRIYSLAVTSEPRILVAACYNCVIRWPLAQDFTIQDEYYLLKNSSRVECLAAHGTRIAIVIGRNIEIWDASTGTQILGALTGHRDPITSVAFSNDGRRLVSSSRDRAVRVWDINSDNVSRGNFPEGCKLSSDGWIRGPEPDRDLIIWIPEASQRRLCWGRTIAVMDGKPAAYLEINPQFMGRKWFNCFKKTSSVVRASIVMLNFTVTKAQVVALQVQDEEAKQD
ncbi:polygalacturonase 3, partial [Favolaschia claudopus]